MKTLLGILIFVAMAQAQGLLVYYAGGGTAVCPTDGSAICMTVSADVQTAIQTAIATPVTQGPTGPYFAGVGDWIFQHVYGDFLTVVAAFPPPSVQTVMQAQQSAATAIQTSIQAATPTVPAQADPAITVNPIKPGPPVAKPAVVKK